MNTWIMNAEDDLAGTVVWRLDNQKADRTRIWLTNEGRPIDGDTAPVISKVIKDNAIDLFVVDPVQAWIGEGSDMNRANVIRAWAMLFNQIISDTGCTVLWARHRRKGDAGEHNQINSGLGSIDFSAAVRSEFGAVVKPNGTRYITRIKGTVGRMNDYISYDITDSGDPANEHGILSWTGETIEKTPNGRPPTKRDTAQAWLMGQLLAGSKLASDIKAAAFRLGIAETTLDRAIATIGRKYQDEAHQWYWALQEAE